MTLQLSGQISAADILREMRNTSDFNINATNSRSLAQITTPLGTIRYSDFYGKNYAFCLYNSNNTVMFANNTYSPSYGNNPIDASGWPYGVWETDANYSYSSGSAYYPLVAPGGPLYYTFGCDNYGNLSYAVAPDQYADPHNLSYTRVCSNVAFPGINSWSLLGNFSAGAVIWIYITFTDAGRVYSVTFAISSTASSSGIITTSRNLAADGRPYYCMSGALLRYTYAIFAQQYGFSLNDVLYISQWYTSNSQYIVPSTGQIYYGLYRKPEISGFVYWINHYVNDLQGNTNQFLSDFYGGMLGSGEYYTRGNTNNKTFNDGGTQGDFLNPPAGYS